MLNTAQIVELVRRQSNTGSLYAASKLLEVRPQTITGYTSSYRVMNDEIGLKAASLLGIDPDYVLACLAAERAKDSPAFKTWAHICQRLTPQNMRESA